VHPVLEAGATRTETRSLLKNNPFLLLRLHQFMVLWGSMKRLDACYLKPRGPPVPEKAGDERATKGHKGRKAEAFLLCVLCIPLWPLHHGVSAKVEGGPFVSR
jgi:hypothetical protein